MSPTSVAHSSSWRCRDTSDETNNRLVRGVVLLQELGCIFFGRSSNFTDHDDTIRLLILQENLQTIDKVCAREGITSNTYDERLAKACLCGLVDGLVGQGSRSRDNTNAAALVNESGHDTDLALSWSDKTWAVGAYQTCLSLCFQDIGDSNHVCQ